MKHVVKDNRPGFYSIQNDVLDDFGAAIGPYGIALYSALCRFASRDGTTFPTMQKLADVTGMSKSAVKKYLAVLSEVGLIEIEERYSDAGDRDSNLYTINDYVGVGRVATEVGRVVTEGESPHDGGVGRVATPNNTHSTNTQLPIPPEEPVDGNDGDAGKKKQRGAVHKCWQENMPGMMTPIIADELNELIDSYGPTSVIHAVGVAVKADIRNMRYVAGILQRENARASPSGNGHHDGKPLSVERMEGEDW